MCINVYRRTAGNHGYRIRCTETGFVIVPFRKIIQAIIVEENLKISRRKADNRVIAAGIGIGIGQVVIIQVVDSHTDVLMPAAEVLVTRPEMLPPEASTALILAVVLPAVTVT